MITFRKLAVLAVMSSVGTLPVAAQTTQWTTGTYFYDGAGNVRLIGTDQFTYDALSRVVTGNAGPNRSQSATYDAWGNIRTLTTNGTQLTFGVNASTNRLTESIDPVTGQSYNVYGTYDAAGRLTSVPAGNSFVYDGADTVTRSTVDSTTKVHLYTVNDERIASVTLMGGAEIRSDWTLRDARGKVLRRLEKNGTLWTWKEDYIHRDGSLLAAEVDTPARTLHFFPDHLGSPRLITGNGGVKVALHTYLPFGTEATAANQDTEKLKFTGHERDANSLDYMHARYYNPNWGRFQSVDPVVDQTKAVHESQRWNRYTYVLNNPVKNNDPDGRETNPVSGRSGISNAELRPDGIGYFKSGRCCKNGKRYQHKAADIDAKIGTPLYAPISGTVTMAGNAGDGKGGIVMRIEKMEDGKKIEVHMSHLDSIPKGTVAGKTTVLEGQPAIAHSGNTGNGVNQPPHVHLAVFVDGVKVDPQKYFADHPSRNEWAEEQKRKKEEAANKPSKVQ